MQENLNLLPQNLQISKGLDSVLKTSKALGVILIVVFIVFSLGTGAFFIYSKITLNNVQTNVEQLKSQVKAQEGSEQQLVLLKDRLAKISSIKSTPNASKNIINMDILFRNMSPSSTMNQLEVTPTKIGVSMLIRSNEDLTAFIKNLKTNEMFNVVNLTSLGYSMNAGYSVIVSLSNK
ncbi:MAG: hypothetical protein UU51_C0007G0008 [Microgenomates group bacterium GW2011_GWC1_41_20]|nr:MAG: hypothetical protein UU51_C0007G0008 [Microgenomates group bacterium GW2011_GWC1_41_20]KKS04284.1 MAG: hypothetical protein UU57_C0022G0009 [Candidatus Woesebacteria bacterium GW2011_GWE1_41_24]OGM81936.1 MAG: hypothetical protein A2393_00850 [Candidatus Woesebacteria bacterium RIFOXYB1_FULL_41_13]OGM84744.1 MAG: hypothetical protein A2434_00660 [Candidatus Woesebacteria bacterium RIFOXYC1_FULL_41_14]OGM88744.1 MAG: hypothetical protein A2594_03255 [Candidatus Woesebacteria bacterium RI